MSDPIPGMASVEDVVSLWNPGSYAWTWATEAADLIRRDGPALADLVESVGRHGVREPILLGDDRRVWDGHHRIIAALLARCEHVPVEYGFGGSPCGPHRRPGQRTEGA